MLIRLRAGDAAARRWLFDVEGPPLWSLIHRLCGDYDLAHDVVQDTFVRAYEKIHRYDGTGSLRGWLSRLAINRLRDEQRTSRRRELALDRAGSSLASENHGEPADPLLLDRVRQAVRTLSHPLRAVLVMHDVEGYTHEEIGDALGIAAGSSRARLSRARGLLRTWLADLKPEEEQS